MIYIGSYYGNYGIDSSINIPRIQTIEYEGEKNYTINLQHNVDKSVVVLNTSDGLTQDSSNAYYYTFSNYNTAGWTEGEYTITLFENENQVFNGLLTYRNSLPSEKVVYQKQTQYTVYG